MKPSRVLYVVAGVFLALGTMIVPDFYFGVGGSLVGAMIFDYNEY